MVVILFNVKLHFLFKTQMKTDRTELLEIECSRTGLTRHIIFTATNLNAITPTMTINKLAKIINFQVKIYMRLRSQVIIDCHRKKHEVRYSVWWKW